MAMEDRIFLIFSPGHGDGRPEFSDFSLGHGDVRSDFSEVSV
jgi:hypothetical protein